jgi:thiamine-phosphate pyrophosphorylase
MPETCLLYYITDRMSFPGDESVRRNRLLAKISEAARAGVDYVQLREKDLLTRDLESLARQAVAAIETVKTENPEIRTALLINSRTDVALAVRSDGVHLRSSDISPQEVRTIWEKCGAGANAREASPTPLLIGVSCHSQEEVIRAACGGATFAVFAPVFEKKNAPNTPAKGLQSLKKACEAEIPVLALGGITLSNARSCLDSGAAGIAAIRLFQDNDINQVVQRLRTES